MPIDHFLSLLQQSVGKGSRSTALQPLVWLMLIMAIVFFTCLKYHAPAWLLTAVLCMVAVVALVYLGSYVYLIFTNIDATRSERFTLEKLALQQSRTGDDRTGFSEGADRRLPALSAENISQQDGDFEEGK